MPQVYCVSINRVFYRVLRVEQSHSLDLRTSNILHYLHNNNIGNSVLSNERTDQRVLHRCCKRSAQKHNMIIIDQPFQLTNILYSLYSFRVRTCKYFRLQSPEKKLHRIE